jgi:aryl-alcohol dehydrogenase-like predicted oxidoreductase
MSSISATPSGQFKVGGDITVNRLGFGAMRLTGPGIWGDPVDGRGARDTLRSLRELDVNLVDTADSYGPFVSENLIREILHPYSGMLIATKGGLTRAGPDLWQPLGRPEYLRQCVLMSLRRLGVERIDLWQLHRIDPKVPRNEQLDVLAEMKKEGLIRHVGLSEVSVDDIRAASERFPVATVQSEYNLLERKNEAVLDYCEQNSIGFIPWFPLAAGALVGPGSVLTMIAERLGATPSQVSLAWMLMRAKVMLPIPGTASAEHLRQNVAAAALRLSNEDFLALDRKGREAAASSAAPKSPSAAERRA